MKINNNLFLTLITSSFFFFSQIWGKKTPDEDIIILYTNDVHCAIDETIGYAGLSYYRDEVVKKTPYVTLVDAGDHVQGANIGSLSSGRHLINIMNAVEYDIAVPGNHEFDYGMDQFNFFAKNLSCSYVSCNIRDLRTGQLLLSPYRILEYGDVKVGFVGITTPETVLKAVANTFQDENENYIYDFDGEDEGEKLVASVQEAVNRARTEGGADYVIAVGHLGENDDAIKVWSAPFVVERTSGIDAFIDGHTHELTDQLMQKNIEGQEVPITQSGTRLVRIGQVTIGKDGSVKTELISPEAVTGVDESIVNLIGEIKETFGEELGVIIRTIGFDLNINNNENVRIIRKEETNLANLITDAFLYESEEYGGADIAMCNSGSIRAPIKAGNITYGNIIDSIPFTNPACIVEVPGQAILDALEMSAMKYPEENSALLHTAGLTYAVDPDIPSSVSMTPKPNEMFVGVTGERRVHSVKVNGEPLDPQKRYRVIATTYLLLENGDGYVFDGSTVINTQFALPSELLISYFKKLGDDIDKYKEPQGRLVYSKKPAEEEAPATNDAPITTVAANETPSPIETEVKEPEPEPEKSDEKPTEDDNESSDDEEEATAEKTESDEKESEAVEEKNEKPTEDDNESNEEEEEEETAEKEKKASKYEKCGKGIGSCKEGYCCSKYGWCGKSERHCYIEEGCQSEFGECKHNPNPTPKVPFGKCGEGIGSCKEGYCCSKYGWCGKTPDYCNVGNGCQSEFGICNEKDVEEEPKKPSSLDWKCGGMYGSCKEGYCCSKYGWCGKSDRHCKKDQGCQSEFGVCH